LIYFLFRLKKEPKEKKKKKVYVQDSLSLLLIVHTNNKHASITQQRGMKGKRRGEAE